MKNYIEFSGIGKSYPGVRALDDINFRAESGKVLALVGENGAGKSTLLRILSGDTKPNEGSVIVDGQVMDFASPHQAIQEGISVIYQERQLVPALSVMENIFPGQIPKNKFGFIDKGALRRETKVIVEKFGLPIDVDEPVGRLSVAYQQMIEIMKAFRRDSDIICFDEPTAPLTDTEIDILFDLICQLKEAGKIIIYVSHRLAEIFKISDEVVVLKDGKLVSHKKTDETNEKELIQSMVGRDLGDTYAKLQRNDKIGDVLLEVKNVCTGLLKNISFELRQGEVLGFAGLIGAGRTEVARAVFGADHITSGEIIFDGKAVQFKEPKEAISAGIALCPEDRKDEGLVLFRTVANNISMPVINKIRKGPFIDKAAEKELTDEAIEKYKISTPSIHKLVRELSGGNQQKVILGRWTNSKLDTKLLILDEPTKGIDVGTKAEIYQMVCDLAKAGHAVIFISSELTEVINVADRIAVMHEGRITGIVTREEATEENVLSLAMA